MIMEKLNAERIRKSELEVKEDRRREETENYSV